MTRRCSICAHPEVATINRAITTGASLRDVAGQFGVSRSSLHRHAADHITEVLAAAAEVRAVEDIALGADLLEHLRDLQRAGLEVLNTARRDGNGAMALLAIKALTPIAERMALLQPPPPPLSPAEARHAASVQIGQRLRELMAARGVDLANPEARARLLAVMRGAPTDPVQPVAPSAPPALPSYPERHVPCSAPSTSTAFSAPSSARPSASMSAPRRRRSAR